MVDGRPYVGSNYRFGGECDDAVLQIVAALPIGKNVQVHYKREAPEQSVVLAGDLSANTKLALVLLPLMMLVSAFLLWLVIWKR
jgi:hypothetical protein